MKPHLELNPSDEAGKNEGIDTSRAYDPPPGYTLVKKSEDAGEFDWDAITKNENREIWLIRVPDGVGVLSSQTRSFILSKKYLDRSNRNTWRISR